MSQSDSGEDAVDAIAGTVLIIVIAVLLAAGLLMFAHKLTDAPKPSPQLAFVDEGNEDQLRVAHAGRHADWDAIQFRTDAPVKFSFNGVAGLLTGQLSPGGSYVAVNADGPVAAGDELDLCSLGLPGEVMVQVLDRTSGNLVYDATMHLASCT